MVCPASVTTYIHGRYSNPIGDYRYRSSFVKPLVQIICGLSCSKEDGDNQLVWTRNIAGIPNKERPGGTSLLTTAV